MFYNCRMINIRDYLLHIINEPPFYQRNCEQDLPSVEKESNIQRFANIALPYICLYNPAAKAISLGMGTLRCGSRVYETHTAWRGNKTWALPMAQTAFALASLAITFFHFRLGLLATTSIDMVFSAAQIYSALQAGDKTKAFQHALQTLSSAAYLSIILTSTLEYILLSVLIQATAQFVQACLEYKKDRKPEALAKLVLALIYAARAPGYMALIRQRNELLALHKFGNLLSSIQKSRRVQHLIFSPLSNLSTQIEEKRVTLQDVDGKSYNFGSHFHGYGKGLVKGMNLIGWSSFDENGKKILKLDFKINHYHRQRLEEALTELKKYPREEIRKLLSLTKSHATDIEIQPALYKIGQLRFFSEITSFAVGKFTPGNSLVDAFVFDKAKMIPQLSPEDQEPFDLFAKRSISQLESNIENMPNGLSLIAQFEPSAEEARKAMVELMPAIKAAFAQGVVYPTIGSAERIDIHGLGRVTIGSSPTYVGIQNRVTVEIEENKNLYQLHELLAFLNLDSAIDVSNDEDIERLKIGQLFRSYYPRLATPFERSAAFFSLPIGALKKEITQIAPDMQTHFDQDLASMETFDILPGRKRYGNPSLDEKCYTEGARALTAVLTGFDKPTSYLERYSSVNTPSLTTLSDQEQTELLARTGNILKMGLLSTELRWMANIPTGGLSPMKDFEEGGADSVFTQLLTKQNFQEKMPLSNLSYNGPIRFIFKFQSDTYQYYFGNSGARNSDFYFSRPSISELIQSPEGIFEEGLIFKKDPNNPTAILDLEKEAKLRSPSHELMLKERMAPENITGILVPDEASKTILLDYLRSKDIVQNETILGKPVDKFIHVGTHLSDDLLD